MPSGESASFRWWDDFIGNSGVQAPEGIDHQRRGRFRRVTPSKPRVPVGRFQGRRRRGQDPADPEQRSRLGRKPVRREETPVLRPLGLQVRKRRATRRRRGHHHPHRAVRGLRVERRADVLVGERRSSCRAATSVASSASQLDDRRRRAQAGQDGRQEPRRARRRREEARVQARSARDHDIARVQRDSSRTRRPPT